jgi:integrase/recombinase XerD
MTKPRNKGRPYSAWPANDRQLWESAVAAPSDAFSDRKLASAASLKAYQYAFSLFLGFLDVRRPDLSDTPTGESVTREVVEEYVGYLRENCREKTVGCALERLANFLSLVHPEADWTWLLRGGRRIRTKGRPQEKRIVLSQQLLELGHKLMNEVITEVEQFGVVVPHAATKYRDGLMIAVLSAAPMRRGSFAKLELGQQVTKAGEVWRIDLPAEETKTHQAASYALSPTISRSVDIYMEIFRPELPGARDHPALWPSRGSKPMSASLIAQSIERRTLKEFGYKVSPHRFRDAAATSIAVHDPANVLMAKDLLSHKTFSMTEKHYIHGNSFDAGRKHIESLQDRMGGSA